MWEFKKTINIGNLITVLSVAISLVSILLSLAKDRKLRLKEQANKIRNAATKTLAKLERYKSISISLFLESQSIYVETSEILVKEYNIMLTRDFLFKKLHETRKIVLDRIMKEEIEIAYVELYGYNTSIKQLFVDSLARLRDKEKEVFEKLILDTQEVVLSFEGKENYYTTAMLGNALRSIQRQIEVSYEEEINEILVPINAFLTELILTSDKNLIANGNLAMR